MPGTYTPKTLGNPNAIRRHVDAGIEQSMQDALKALPKGKKGALVLYSDKHSMIRGALYGRKKGKLFGLLPGEWTYVATAGRTWTGDLEGAAAVGFSWP